MTSEPVSEPAPPAPQSSRQADWARWLLRNLWKLLILIVGITLILAGVAMLVLPGQGILTILGGLALLATEFAWAKWTLKWAREKLGQAQEKALEMIGANGAANGNRDSDQKPPDEK